jgi:16S rRNA (guanine527-N7)-methyltransferase
LTDEPPAVPAAPPAAERLFGAALPQAERYAELLCTEGLVRGLLGPREAPRIWERHILNGGVVAELVRPDARVADVGSGAGLPGIPMALARPDLGLVLLEPLARRCVFLELCVEELGVADRVRVVRGRAPDARNTENFPTDYVVARAVAPLERLISWTMPLVAPGGDVLAVRGERAEQELQEALPGMARLGAGVARLAECGSALLDAPVRVVRVPRKDAADRRGKTRGHRRPEHRPDRRS